MGSLMPGWDSDYIPSESLHEAHSLPRSFTEVKKHWMDKAGVLSKATSDDRRQPRASDASSEAAGEDKAHHDYEEEDLEIEYESPTAKPRIAIKKRVTASATMQSAQASSAPSWWQRSNHAFLNEPSMTRQDLLGAYTPQFVHKAGMHESYPAQVARSS
eukprot:jgi/Chlat1/918/Chrsp108S01357